MGKHIHLLFARAGLPKPLTALGRVANLQKVGNPYQLTLTLNPNRITAIQIHYNTYLLKKYNHAHS